MKLLQSFWFGSFVLAHTASALAQPAAPPPAGAPPPAAPPPAASQGAAAPVPATPLPPEAPPPVAPPPVAPAPVAVAPVAPKEEAKPAPKTLEVGSGGGSWQPGGLLQFWMLASHQDMQVNDDSPLLGDEQTFNMRMRRAEIRVKGDIVPKRIQFQIMIDPARALEVGSKKITDASGTSVTVTTPNANSSALTILQDFYITFPTDYVDISVGQFKIPVSMEGYGSSSKILFPERAPVSRQFGDKRDIGLRFEKKIGKYFGYYAGIFNGTGQNKWDDDTEKDMALRLEVYPYEGITVAGVGYATVGKRERSSRDRLEGDIKYDANNVYVVAEYIRAWDTTNDGPAVEGNGAYVQAAYTFFDHLQPMVRFGDLDVNMDKAGDHYWHYEGGVNWLFQKHEAKIGLSVSYFDPTNPTPPTYAKRLEGILAAQVAF